MPLSADRIALKDPLYFTAEGDKSLVIGYRGSRDECVLMGRAMTISKAMDAIERGKVAMPVGFADASSGATLYDPRRLFELCEFKQMHVRYPFLLEYHDCFPRSVRTLDLEVDGKKRLPESIVFPDVECVMVNSGEMFFRHGQFPAARHFCLKMGGDGKLLNELSQVGGILTFEPRGIASLDGFVGGPWEDVVDLRLVRTGLVDLKGIEVFKGARKVRISDNSKLEDVGGLSCFRELDYLLFSYCKKIRSAGLLKGVEVGCFDVYSCEREFQSECLSLYAGSYLLQR